MSYFDYKGIEFSKYGDAIIRCRVDYTGRLTIRNGVEKIFGYAFLECRLLTSVEMPNSVKEIRTGAFEYCTSLKTVTLSNCATVIGVEAFYGCTALKKVEMPVGVTEIHPSAFAGCTSLTSITVPKSVTKIWKGAFYGSGLKKLHLQNEHPEDMKLDDEAFSGLPEGCVLLVPQGSEDKYRSHPVFGKFKKIIAEKI